MTERESGTPGRRALLGAAVLSTAALGLAGTAQAQAAERGRGGHGGGHGS
ncbi:glycerophosphodiester phosphodiesterase, partial [Streptomyces sp. SID2119]|nr:glycerophosphodiester phosphodiesterase [Streptomyces sp. SID2119]